MKKKIEGWVISIPRSIRKGVEATGTGAKERTRRRLTGVSKRLSEKTISGQNICHADGEWIVFDKGLSTVLPSPGSREPVKQKSEGRLGKCEEGKMEEWSSGNVEEWSSGNVEMLN